MPAKPAYARVKIWRRLKGLGAVTVKNSVYALPANAETQEDFAWLVKEIAELGGEAFVCEAQLVDGLGDGEVRALFDAARDEDYAEIAAAARDLGGKRSDGTDAEFATQVARLRKQLDEIVAIDFFGADGREPAEGLVSGLEAGLHEEDNAVTTTETRAASDPLKGRTWVTRQGVQVDRIASAWLIRRFIDGQARFKFVPPKGYRPRPGELRFDRYEAEYTHEADRCTFEVLVARFRLEAAGLRAIGEVVHDVDLRDDDVGRDETDGVERLIAGLCLAHRADVARLDAGATVFDALFAYFDR
ncbi:MAG: chromate resistance protein ChrB domain-containing protein [Reyranella sp.]